VTALSTHPVQAQARRRRITPPVVIAGAVLGASVLLHVRDPHEGGSYLFCPWLVLTGTYCPGCGGLRAVNDLSRGELASALSSNVLFVGSIPLLLWLWTRWFTDRWRGVQRVVDHRRGVVWACVFGGVALTFWVVRNLPGLEWLAP
jgi:hypothetical protein